jgi:hypothetical protein
MGQHETEITDSKGGENVSDSLSDCGALKMQGLEFSVMLVTPQPNL